MKGTRLNAKLFSQARPSIGDLRGVLHNFEISRVQTSRAHHIPWKYMDPKTLATILEDVIGTNDVANCIVMERLLRACASGASLCRE